MVQNSSPGTFSVGVQETPSVTFISYDSESANVRMQGSKDYRMAVEFAKSHEPGKVHWLHCVNFKNDDFLKLLKEKFKLHSLTMEDIVRENQRPKHECYDDYDNLFLQIYSKEKLSQVSVIFTEDVVISFSEASALPLLNPVFDSVTKGHGRIRKKKADYLTYRIADAVVDNYFNVLEKLEFTVDKLDDEATAEPNSEVLKSIHDIKREILHIKKVVWPLREMATSMQRGESKFVKEETFVFVRDLYDHTVRIVESTESLRDVTYGLVDLYMSSTGMKMNQAMKVLTIISTVFVPITFVTSVYGMNFDIPELKLSHGYMFVWGIMLTIAVSLFVWFKKRRWL